MRLITSNFAKHLIVKLIGLHVKVIFLHVLWIQPIAYLHRIFQFQVRFMLDIMLALKNNDMRKIPGYDPEPVERFRKLQRSLVMSQSC